MDANSRERAGAERRQRVLVLQPAELALHSGAATIERFHSSEPYGMRSSGIGLFLRSETIGTQPSWRVSSMTRGLSYPLSIAHVLGWKPRARSASRSGASSFSSPFPCLAPCEVRAASRGECASQHL